MRTRIVVPWVELKRFLEVRLCLFELTLPEQHFTQIGLNGSVVRIQFRRFGEVRIRCVEIDRLFGQSDSSQSSVRVVQLRVNHLQTTEDGLRFFELALLVEVQGNGCNRLKLRVGNLRCV